MLVNLKKVNIMKRLEETMRIARKAKELQKLFFEVILPKISEGEELDGEEAIVMDLFRTAGVKEWYDVARILDGNVNFRKPRKLFPNFELMQKDEVESIVNQIEKLSSKRGKKKSGR